MNSIEKWAERVYSETDFGRSIATSVAGIIGLTVYLIKNDWVIAAFSSIIAFPIFRLSSTWLQEKLNRKKKRLLEIEEAKDLYNRLSQEERLVVDVFMRSGGSVLTWSQMNNQPVASGAVESMIQRELIWTSVTADGMRETFVLEPKIFDIANQNSEVKKTPN